MTICPGATPELLYPYFNIGFCLLACALRGAQAAKSRVLIVKTHDSAFYNPMVEGSPGLKARGFRSGEQPGPVITALQGITRQFLQL